MGLITDFDAEAGDGIVQSYDITPRQSATTHELTITEVRSWSALTYAAALTKARRDANKPFENPPTVLRDYEFSSDGGYAFSKDISFGIAQDNSVCESYILTRTITITAQVNRQYNSWYINKFSPEPGKHTFPVTVRISRGGTDGTSMLYAVRMLDGEEAVSNPSAHGPATTTSTYVDVELTVPSIIIAVAWKSGTGWGDGMIGVYTE